MGLGYFFCGLMKLPPFPSMDIEPERLPGEGFGPFSFLGILAYVMVEGAGLRVVGFRLTV